MEDENRPSRGRRLWALFAWLGAASAVAGILSLVFQVIDRDSPATPPTTQVSGAAVVPTVTANGDEQFLQAGQCVRNVGSTESPVFTIAACGPDSQRVVARVERAITDEAQARALCEREAADFTEFHYSNWEKRSDYVDVVFCLGPA